MRDWYAEITFREVAPGTGVWKAQRGRTYLGMIIRHADTVYVPVIGGKAYPKVSNLELAKVSLIGVVDGSDK